MPETDIELLRGWGDGDRSAGDRLFARHFRSVFRFFRNKTEGEPEELTQRVFLRCVEARDRYRGSASFRTFLFAIARNVLREHFRERRANERLEFGSVSAADLGVSAGTVVATSQEQRLLLNALRRLSVDRQLLVELYYWEELSITELAGVFATPPGTIKRWLWRSRQQLATALNELAGAPLPGTNSIENLDAWARALRTAVDTRSDGNGPS